MRALNDIRKYQISTDLLLPKAPFARLVREILFDINSSEGVNRVQSSALSGLQEITELEVVRMFQCKSSSCSNLCNSQNLTAL